MTVPDAAVTAAALQWCWPAAPAVHHLLFDLYAAGPDEFWRGELPHLVAAAGSGSMRFFGRRDSWCNLARMSMDRLASLGVQVLRRTDALFPPLLNHISVPPLQIYAVGDPRLLQKESVTAVVGTRNATAAGISVAERIGSRITAAGGVVVSGGAAGIDAAVLSGALESGPAAAVLPGGLDRLYPSANRGLFQRIASSGVLLSELPPGVSVRRYYFPARNRLLSGLSHRAIIVQAPERSGALLTAYSALDQGRDLFVVPWADGLLQGAGCRRLLEEGAAVLPEKPDWLDRSLLRFRFCKPGRGLSSTAVRVLEQLDLEWRCIESLCTESGLPVRLVEAAITELELAGLVDYWPGGGYTRRLEKSA